MKQQIQKILELEGLTPAKFADLMGVQRSNISHLLNERNKPSLDFILKLLEIFPDISAEWLLTGIGNIKKPMNLAKQTIEKSQKQQSLFDSIPEVKSQTIENSKEIPVTATTKEIEENIKVTNVINDVNNMVNNVNKLNKIIFFYSDGTFEVFTPNA